MNPPTGVRTTLVYDDLRDLPNDGNRYELVEGHLHVTPCPSPRHQRASKRLQRMLEAYFEDRDLGEVFGAPLDVILTPRDVFEPDLLVVANAGQISDRAIEGPPLLAVEILSESTIRHDRVTKAARYAALGIPHYWIVDPESRVVECYHLAEATTRCEEVLRARTSDEFVHPEWPDLRIDVQRLWAPR